MSEAWLSYDHQFAPGEEIFRSEREFSVWAYTVSHSQLLLRARVAGGQPRLDVLFKPVEAVKIRTDYEGLAIRCATFEERHRILSDLGQIGSRSRVLMLVSGGGSDYVISSAVGWKEDHGDDRDPSSLAFFPPGTDPKRILPGE
ncbi:hypothetical protein [Micromonospora sp. SL4-19]|uniref:hypothetical protein n=1 Tax=Micromonospora sp. SL4-19 TaxID=3399129 RepID=UPI003A4D5DDF